MKKVCIHCCQEIREDEYHFGGGEQGWQHLEHATCINRLWGQLEKLPAFQLVLCISKIKSVALGWWIFGATAITTVVVGVVLLKLLEVF